MEIYYRNYIPDTYEELSNVYTIDEWKEKYIILFGLNPPIEIVYSFFEKNNIKVSAIIDNSTEKYGNKYKGCSVVLPAEILSEYRSNAIIIIASSAYKQMMEQIIDMGYSENQIYRLKTFYKSAQDFDIYNENSLYRKMSLKEIQQKAFEMLKSITAFCDKEKIRYFLSDGTLLGAIRHKGFIPWDDDIDISMPMEDYIFFCKNYNHPTYKICSMYNKNAYDVPCNSQIAFVMNTNTVTGVYNYPIYSRLGICVDIFPLNGYPDTEEERTKYEGQLREMSDIWQRTVRNKIDTEKYSVNDHKILWDKVQKLMNMYSYDQSEYVGGVCCLRFNHSIAKRSDYEGDRYEYFNGTMFHVPRNAEIVLKNAYGDYNKLPPEEKRVPKHFMSTYYCG